MPRYLMLLGVVIMVIGVVGGGSYISTSHNEYEARLKTMEATPGAPVAMFDDAKWGIARALGMAMIFGGVVWGSLLMGLGWMCETTDEIRRLLASTRVQPADARQSASGGAS